MRRRDFIGGAISVAALSRAHAQPARPVIGFLHAGSAEENVKRLAAFRRGLARGGFTEGENVVVEYRWASGRNEELPALAADLVRRNVTLIATPGSTAAAVAARKATATMPIVFSSGTDPVALGLVDSLNRPGGNATGITSLNAELSAKRLGIFRELVPGLSRCITLVKPGSALAAPFAADLKRAAAPLGMHVEVLNADTDNEIDAAIAGIAAAPDTGLVFGPEGFFYVHRARIAELALRHRLPAIFDVRDYVEAGGLASYGSDYFNVMELAGEYTARVLKGARPAELPVQQAIKFELVLNRKTATTLGLAISPTLLGTADDVIE
ncbi:ABC transporter substrate-binding protein [Bradyrhizobium sp. BR 10289]|uniref:ABC transporter substrate-binding protein n=1 Tax=Bradyrhizobium sp. BR 10289 TaxID=2749993 RepID=UPI001C65351A|nr:ABC transporter substrate-binding protein [Bradyrhizobium sp. BR 10289]MBW7974865.1 ABC transporter substrate-binding protein [Bradyrhizobium sp. BR 10289]